LNIRPHAAGNHFSVTHGINALDARCIPAFAQGKQKFEHRELAFALYCEIQVRKLADSRGRYLACVRSADDEFNSGADPFEFPRGYRRVVNLRRQGGSRDDVRFETAELAFDAVSRSRPGGRTRRPPGPGQG